MPNGAQDRDVTEFLEKEEGYLIVISHDTLVYRVLRLTVNKTLAVRRECVVHSAEAGKAVSEIVEKTSRNRPVVLFVERIFNGRPCTEFLQRVRKVFPDIRLIVLTDETFREVLIYLHELGVDNVLVKPASVNNVIEKIAASIKPRGRLNRILDQARHALRSGDLSAALNLSAAVLAEKPRNPAGLTLRGDCLQALGRTDEALGLFEAARRHAKGDYLEPLKRLAAIYKKTDQTKYLECLKAMDAISPLNKERKTEIGVLCAARGDEQNAIAYLDETLRTATSEAMADVVRLNARIAETVADAAPRLAEKYLAQAVAQPGKTFSKSDKDLFNRLGIAQHRQGKWQEAVKNYEKALLFDRNDEIVHYNMGLACLSGADFHRAMRCFERALKLNPDFYEGKKQVCHNLGLVYSEMNMPSEAAFYLRKCLELDANHAQARKLLKSLESSDEFLAASYRYSSMRDRLGLRSAS